MTRLLQNPAVRLGIVVLLLLVSCIGSFWAETVAFIQVITNLLVRVVYFILTLGQTIQGIEPTPEFTRLLMIFLIVSVFFTLVFLVTLYFNAQFVLPVSNGWERILVFLRLLAYIIFQHGPAIFVKGGQKVASPEELDRPGWGVILADLSSAVVIEDRAMYRGLIRRTWEKVRSWLDKNFKKSTPHAKVRVEGPGIIFLNKSERVRDFTDLRPQFRLRPQVSARTRDGIVVEANVHVRFTLGLPPEVLQVTYLGEPRPENIRVIRRKSGDGNTLEIPRGADFVADLADELDLQDKVEIHRFAQNRATQVKPASRITSDPNAPFIFDKKRNFAAVFGKALDPSSDKEYRWDDLPVDVAARLFRDLIARENYDALYQFDVPNLDALKYDPERDNRNRPEPGSLQKVKATFAQQMRNQGVLAYQYVHRKDGLPITKGMLWQEELLEISPVQELQASKVLRRRGIRVIFSGFSVLRPTNAAIRKQLVDHWKARWDRDEKTTLAEHQLRASLVRSRARARAHKELTRKLAELFAEYKHSETALTLQLYQALESMAVDTKTRALLPGDTLKMLDSLRYWITPRSKGLPLTDASHAGKDGPGTAASPTIIPVGDLPPGLPGSTSEKDTSPDQPPDSDTSINPENPDDPFAP